MKQTTTMSKGAALDTNILVYLHDTVNLSKREISAGLLFQRPHIAAQVISEYLNVVRKILPLPKDELLTQTVGLLRNCSIINTQLSTLSHAAALTKAYRFQLFDAIIVAAALEAGCDTLYSEDMQHGLVVEKSLRIVNPFL